MDTKSILAIVLSLIVLYAYQVYVATTHPPRQPAPAQQADQGQGERSGQVLPSGTQPEHDRNRSPLALQGRKDRAEKSIVVNTDEYTARFSTRGGALTSFQLKKYRQHVDQLSDPIELVRLKEGMPSPLALSFSGSDFSIPDDIIYDARLEPARPGPGGSPVQRLTFTLDYPGNVKIEKTFQFHQQGYQVDLELRTINESGNALTQQVALNWHEYVDPNAEQDYYGHDGPVYVVAKSIEREDVGSIASEKTYGPDISWGAYESKYFIAAMIPQNPSLSSLSLSKNTNNLVTLKLKSPKNIIPSGQASLSSYTLYLGPKDYTILSTLNVGLESSIDFGDWLKWLAMPLLLTLKFLHDTVFGNYGLAIIILTILIKIIFWPLGNKSYRSMKEMQKLQPKMAEIREKYKNDKARVSQEMMALYKLHKVNPMGGCLPMVIQIPVFFGLYKTLLYAIELRHSPLIWWIQDLSAKDPYYITPIIMGGTMFLQQKMTPTTGDPIQAKIMLFMPVIFTVMFLNFPSGLVIYWLFNNIISIGQQYYINIKQS